MVYLIIASVVLSLVIPSHSFVQCPDGITECSDGSTCCLMSNNKYGCCPLPNATCCTDHTHCCPKGFQCDLSSHTCYRGNDRLKMLSKVPAKLVKNEVELVKCNETVACPDKNTCCKTSNGFMCCPFSEAVCCTQQNRCCPRGWKCVNEGQSCAKDGKYQHSHKLLITHHSDTNKEYLSSKDISISCPDGQSQCPDGNTCCKLSSGQYGCCPLPKAVCCADGVHCCPNGYTCDVSSGTCNKGLSIVAMIKKLPSKPIKKDVDNVICPDGQSECPDGNTCCKLSSGQYGCCPLPKAECCADGVHCCPNGYTCDVSSGTCNKGSSIVAMIKKLPSKPIKKDVRSVICPDGQSQCPDGNTCCKLSSGQYGCCPLPKAECCADHIHCCPNGYTCDVSSGTCNKGASIVAMIKKLPSKPIKKDVDNVMCPDGQSQCPDGNTCCKLSSGQYGCCPLPKAVCCTDGVHCCPNGYTCDVSSGSCNKGSSVVAMIKKLSSKPIKKDVRSVICPDGQSQCPDGNTCCKLSSGQYGCCPLPKAECCADHIHCCPNGYTCDVSSGSCNKGSSIVAMIKKLPSKPIKKDVDNVMCPDGQSQCPDGNTCCKLSSGQYGCCPLPKAVCCTDHIHCCPNGYTCDTSSGTCNKGAWIVAMIKNLSSKPIKKDVENVMCPDGQSQCPYGNTCCKLSSGQYGCCPLPKAVCCTDGVHCCPNGYTCDVSSGSCNKGSSVVAMIKKLSSKPMKKDVRSVICPDGQSQCPDGNTCCKLSSGQYGCCPLPKAVCCADGVHCCPNGYTCDVSSGTCNKGSSIVAMIKKLPSKPIKKDVRNVMCPDGQSQCPDGNTCCKLSSGQYGCCPLPKAVCCTDHIHCCPNGYTCDTSSGTCNQGSSIVAMIKKLPSKPIKKDVRNVMCPDGQSQCPDGNTCCKLSSGQYGCCPLPKAVCCADGVHCCPNGYTCDVSSGTCNKGLSIVAMIKKLPSKPIKKDVDNVMCPDGKSQCPDGNTCCKLSSGQYGCCPLPKAVCCTDHIHCCPNGYTCDTSSGTCNKGAWIVAMIKNLSSKPIKKDVENVMCPDGQSQCPYGNTCCKLSSGQYGCCPLPKAVCCTDGVHCCPNSYTCDVSSGSCNKGSSVVAMIKKLSSKPMKKDVRSVICPDGQSQCPDGNTCCKLSSGQYGCCPLPKAVCCADGVHCCPNGYTCDVSSGTCNKGSSIVAMIKKLPSKPIKKDVRNVMCPDGQSQCPDGNTCCKLSSGQYGCCPLPKAVCCTDHIHCCPNGYTCDTSSGTCNQGSSIVAMIKKLPSKPIKKDVRNVMCPDGQSQCPDGNTCCKLSSGQYGCCPLPKAVCCADGVHCCPNGYTCDVSSGTCNKGLSIVAMIKKLPSKPIKKDVDNVMCPDGQSQCPDGNTCCKLSSGQYGCCPLPKAVCCTDHIHCCPNGYTCDTSSGTCNRGLSIVAMIKKRPSKPIKKDVRSVICPDGQSECPDGNTCCKLSSGQYGCCPLPKAVCCTDHIHCCPNGYTCDTSSDTCNKGSSIVAMIKKLSSKPIKKDVENVMCPDGQSQCPYGNTCCKLSSGQYGCCPLPKAVCCTDHIHCCPNGYTCDTSSGTCNKGSSIVAMIKKLPSKPIKKDADNVMCPDGQSQCPDDNTCCKLSSGQYGCCPLPKAVCCADHIHCCPNGYTCDVSSGTCNQGSSIVAMIKKLPSKPIKKDVDNVMCPDGQSQCPDGNTCCKLSSGQYGCCPLPKAVCCTDGVHCRPNGYTCDVSSGSCNKGSSVVAMIKKLSSKPIKKDVRSVICPDAQSQCPDGNTCCKLSSGQYGCCPLPKAECCADHIHCCPNGYTCDVSSGTCNKGASIVAMIKKLPSKPIKKDVDNVMCPDGQSQCPDGNTCCKLSSGQYGCCPLPKAVCCTDGVHCCPNGYTCDVSSGSCNKGSSVVAMIKKLSSKPIKKDVRSVICPDGQSQCPDGNTCCKLSSGQYGCCPLPKAECCADHIHCCPNGYTCDVSSGSCNKGSSVVAMIKKLSSKPIKKDVRSVICPDGQSQCPDGNTCCKLSSGQYGCCPLPKAECCADHIHCCPNGYTCDVSSGTCNKGASIVAMIKKLPSKPIKKDVRNVMCPDGQSQCPDGNTCCKLSSGQYGCCPLPKAVCCTDGVHCCPNGYTCDVSSGSCNKGSSIVAMIKKLSSKPRNMKDMKKELNAKDIYCPDGSRCLDYETCCELTSPGDYGCCPLPNAVCCPDRQHCCPNGYNCDPYSHTCYASAKTVPWLSHRSWRVGTSGGTIKCNDGSECNSGETCCEIPGGKYGCCPLPSAVCCADQEHCCPAGYTCDEKEKKCTSGNSLLPMLTKTPSRNTLRFKSVPLKIPHTPTTTDDVIRFVPKGFQDQCHCSPYQTCCKGSQGEFHCCPLPNASCCSDVLHCCPEGFTCDSGKGCVRK